MLELGMKKIDARKQSTEVQQHNREQAMWLRSEGMKRSEICRIVGIHPSTLGAWIALYNKGGMEALKIGQRGRRVGEGRRLSAAQEKRLEEIVLGKCPDQMQLPFALWSAPAIRAVVKSQWGLDLPTRTVQLYLKRWGYTPQKATKRAYERSDVATREWLEKTYPYIKKRAAWQGGTVFWGDETGMSNQCQHERGYAPKGQTPIIQASAKRFRTNLISAVTNQGKLRFMMYQENMTAKVLVRFMRRLIRDTDRKVFLILDNLKVHHARVVKNWLEANADKIEVYYLPACSPDMNPDEYLNCDLKQGLRVASPARSQAQMEKRVFSHMRKLQALPERIKSYFRHPAIQYAAAGI